MESLHLENQGAGGEQNPAQCRQPEDTARSSTAQLTHHLPKTHHLIAPAPWDGRWVEGKGSPLTKVDWEKPVGYFLMSQESSGHLIHVMKGISAHRCDMWSVKFGFKIEIW